MIRVPLFEVQRLARLLKEFDHHQVYFTISENGTIPDEHVRWFAGRSDFVLKPGFVVLTGLQDQTEEAIVYAICMVIRNQEGYFVA